MDRTSESKAATLDPDAQCVEVAGWHINLATGEMNRHGRAVRLAPKVAETLKILVHSQGRVLSKDELMAAIWPDTIVGDDALWRCISELRTALGENADGVSVIETLPRRGYRLIAPVAAVADAPALATSDSHQTLETPAPETQPPGSSPLPSRPFRFSGIKWRLGLGIVAAVALGLWLAMGLPRSTPVTNGETQTAVSNPRGLVPSSEAEREWLDLYERAEEVSTSGGSARIEQGFTAAGLNALIRAGRAANSLDEAMEITAMAMHSRGRLGSALEGYQAVLSQDETSARASRYLPATRAELAVIAARLEPQRAAIVADPENPDHWVALGRTHRLLEERDPAWRNLAEALRLDPEHVDATVEIARVHLTQGSLGEARQVTRRALTLRPEEPKLLLLAAEIEILDNQALRAADFLDRACMARVAATSGEPPAPERSVSEQVPLCWLD